MTLSAFSSVSIATFLMFAIPSAALLSEWRSRFLSRLFGNRLAFKVHATVELFLWVAWSTLFGVLLFESPRFGVLGLPRTIRFIFSPIVSLLSCFIWRRGDSS